MKDVRVSVVASWTGWCGDCADERPLVLTRSGRRSLRQLWSGSDELPLTLTCKVCGTGVDVPLREEDDPEVVPGAEPVVVEAPAPVVVAEPEPEEPAWAPVLMEPVYRERTAEPVAPLDPVALQAGRQSVADVLAALVRARAEQAPAPAAPVAIPSPYASEELLHLVAGGLGLHAADESLPQAASA